MLGYPIAEARMNSLKKEYLGKLKFDTGQAATLRAIGEYKGRQELFNRQIPETLETLRTLAIIESTESSNRLEGVTAEPDRIRALVQRSATPIGRSEGEIAGYRDALALIHEASGAHAFDVNTVKLLHTMLYRYTSLRSGEWKSGDNVIIERTPDGKIKERFRPVNASETPEAMRLLVERYAEALRGGGDPMVIVPLAVFDFLCIHPFMDGNGRVARLLTVLLLYHAGYQVARYISLERIIEESRETYYEVLERSSQGWHEGKHDIMPWLTYIWGVLIRAYKEFEERVGTITTSWGSKSEQVGLAVKRQLKPFAISDIENECPGISREMIRHVLRQMRDKGEIRSTGIGRGAKWVRI